MTTNYCDILKPEAERVLRPLADEVQAREAELAAVRKRLATETAKADGAESDLAALKAKAPERLGSGQNAYEHFRTMLRKRTALLATSREIVGVLGSEIEPAAERALDAARTELTVAGRDFYARQRAGCESNLARLLAEVVTEYDGFARAMNEIRKTYATACDGEAPRPYVPRLKKMAKTLTGSPWLVFKPLPPAARAPAPLAPEPPPEAPEASQDAPGGRGPVEATQESPQGVRAPETPPSVPLDGAGEDVEGAALEPDGAEAVAEDVGDVAEDAEADAGMGADARLAPTPGE